MDNFCLLTDSLEGRLSGEASQREEARVASATPEPPQVSLHESWHKAMQNKIDCFSGFFLASHTHN